MVNDQLKQFGELMRRARTDKGLTLSELAKKVGVSGSTLCRYELGIQRPKRKTIRRIAAATGGQLRSLIKTPRFFEDFERAQNRHEIILEKIHELNLKFDRIITLLCAQAVEEGNCK